MNPNMFEAQPVVVRLDSIDYMLGPSYDLPPQLKDRPSGKDMPLHAPVTVFVSTDVDEFSRGWMDEQFMKMAASDDVWSTSFAKNVIYQTKTDRIWAIWNDEHFGVLSDIPLQMSENRIPAGPYFHKDSKLYQAFRLFPDPLGAFVCGVIRTARPSRFDIEPASFQAVAHGLIPIPSRLGFEESDPATPLAGKRIAVKDIFDLKGVKTTLCSRGYEDLTDEARITATCIQRLIDLGAVVVGKVKTSPFASGMGPRDWVDFQPPFNPRGDGYLDPGCSSAGSGAAIAGYNWLDVAIGSDTLGSMVGPACNNGIFGLRPSHGRLKCNGALPVCYPLDTPGNFSRDLSELGNFTRLWMKGPEMAKLKAPTRFLVPPERFTRFVPEVANVMEKFIQHFEKATGVKRTSVTMEDLWASNRPSKYAGKSFQDTFGTTLAHLQLYGHYQNTIKHREDYKKKFGRELYAEPLLSYKWALGAKLTAPQYAEALVEKELFSDFFRNHVLGKGGVMLLPCSANDVAYRDTYDGTVEECARRWQGFDVPDTAFSGLGGGPALAFPAGHRLYDSKITKVKEYQPVGLMLLSAPGTDEHLIELLKHVLVERKLPTSVTTGRVMYEDFGVNNNGIALKNMKLQ